MREIDDLVAEPAAMMIARMGGSLFCITTTEFI